MERILEIKIGEHYLNVDHHIQVCGGSGEWSSKRTDHELVTGPEIMFSKWLAECPQCRKVVEGVDSRLRPLVKETIAGALNKIKDIVRRGL